MLVAGGFSSVLEQLLPLRHRVFLWQLCWTMQLIKFSVVSLVLFAITWRSRNAVADQALWDYRLNEAVAHTLTSCYGDRIHGVGLAGNLPDKLITSLSTKKMIPLILNDDKSSSPHYKNVRFRQQVQIFVVEASSVQKFFDTVAKNIRSTIWWNHMASFIILDRSWGCSHHLRFLFQSWKLLVLNAKVICHSRSRGIIILNYNPYTTHAPAPWYFERTYVNEKIHPFAIFSRPYEKSEEICVNLDFDKTQNLGKYAISIGQTVKGRKYTTSIGTETSTNQDRYWRTIDRVFDNILRNLNASPRYTTIMSFNDALESDIRQIGILMIHAWDTTKTTYPYAHNGFILVSQFRGHKTQLEKILYVIDFDSRLGMGIVYFITLIFLKFFVHQALVPALLNLVRITSGMGFENLSNGNSVRIFLTALLFFVVTMQGIYQGNLASLLTTHIPRRNVEVLQDIIDLDYRLYSNDYMGVVVKQYPKLQERFKGLRLDGVRDCIGYVANDSSSACLWIGQGTIYDLIEQNELHTSSEFVIMLYTAFAIRWNWPLEERVNIILSRMVEADVTLPWDIKCKPVYLSAFKYDKEVQNNKDFKNIELSEVAFAFVILGIGLLCAAIVFIIEVAMSLV